MLDEEIARQITDRLVSELQPSRVVWYGSRARGESRQWSDYDFIVVADTNLPAAERAFKAQWAARDVVVPKDILVVTPEEYALYSTWKSSVVHAAVQTGKILYEASH